VAGGEPVTKRYFRLGNEKKDADEEEAADNEERPVAKAEPE